MSEKREKRKISAIKTAASKDYDRKQLEKIVSVFGIIIRPGNEDRVRRFLKRLEKNEKLADAFRQAAAAGVNIFLDIIFKVETGFVIINQHRDDEEIIKFLLGED